MTITIEPDRVDRRDATHRRDDRRPSPHQHPRARGRRDRRRAASCARRASTTATPCSARPPARSLSPALLFGWIAPLSGVVGFIVVAFFAFVALYALLVSIDRRRARGAWTGDDGRARERRRHPVRAPCSFVVVFTLFRGWDGAGRT